MPVVYNPDSRINGYDYFSVGQVLKILHGRCDRERVISLCERALTERPDGLELRNEYLLPIRSGLQMWREGTTLASMLKTMLSAFLDDSIEGGKFDYRRMNLDTVIAFDPSKLLEERMHSGRNRLA